MMARESVYLDDVDPLVYAIERGEIIDAAVLDAAIKYRQAQIDLMVIDANRLESIRRRMLAQPPYRV